MTVGSCPFTFLPAERKCCCGDGGDSCSYLRHPDVTRKFRSSSSWLKIFAQNTSSWVFREAARFSCLKRLWKFRRVPETRLSVFWHESGTEPRVGRTREKPNDLICLCVGELLISGLFLLQMSGMWLGEKSRVCRSQWKSQVCKFCQKENAVDMFSCFVLLCETTNKWIFYEKLISFSS